MKDRNPFKKGELRAVKAGSKGGKSTVKKLGTKGMSEIGKKGAEKRWKSYAQVEVASVEPLATI